MAGSDFQRLIRIIFDSGPVRLGMEGVATDAGNASRSVADLQKQLAAVQAASAKVTTPKGLEQIQRLSQQATAGIQATTVAMGQKLRAMQEEDAWERQGGTARAQGIRQRTELAALIRAGTTATSAEGQTIRANLAAQEKMATQIAEITARRKADAKAAAEQAAAQLKLDASLGGFRRQTAVTSRTTAATASGPAAVAALNRELAVENALLASGAAKIDAQGRLVVVNEANAASVRTVVGALNQEQAALAKVQAEMATGAKGAGLFAGAIKEIGQALKFTLIYGGIFAAASFFSDGIKKATEYNTVLTQVQTLAGESARQTQAWNKDLIAMGPAVGRGPVELAKALYQVTSTGQHGAVALDIVRKSAEASAIGLGDTAVIARTVTGAMNAYGAANLSAADATDTLVAMVKLGGGEADAFASTLGRVLPVASAVGVSFQQVGAFMATFTRLGVSAAEAATAARGALNALELQNTRMGRKQLKDLGISYADLRKEIADKGLAQALVDIQHKFKGNEEGLRDLIPNIRALTGVLAVAKSQEQEYLAVNAEIQSSLGHIRREAFELTSSNPGFVFDQMKAAVEGLKVSIGQGLLPSLAESAKGFTDVIRAMDPRALEQFGRDLGAVFNILSSTLGVVVKIADAMPGIHTFFEYRAATAATEAKTKDWRTATVELDKSLADLKARSAGMDFAGQRGQVELTTAAVLKQAIAWRALTEAQLESAVGEAQSAGRFRSAVASGIDRITGAEGLGASLIKPSKEAEAAAKKVRDLTTALDENKKKIIELRNLQINQKIYRGIIQFDPNAPPADGPGGGGASKTGGKSATDSAREEILKSIALKQQEAKATATLAAAELGGAGAVRAATLAKESDRAVEEARLRAEKAKIPFLAEWEAQIRAAYKAEADSTLVKERNAAAYNRQIEAANASREAIARATDAATGNSNASRVLGAIFRAEAEERRLGVTELAKEAEAQERAKIASEARAKATQDAYQADVRARQAAAALADAVADSSDASEQLARDLAAENVARAVGDALSPGELATLQAKARFSVDLARATDRRTQAQNALNAAERGAHQDAARIGAGALDFRQQADAAARYGDEIAGVLQQFGLLNDASRQLEIHEQARAIAGKAASEAQIAAIEAQLTGYDQIVRRAQEAAAGEAIMAQRAKMVADTVKGIGEQFKSALIDQIVEGEASWNDLAKSAERALLEMIFNVLRNFLAAEAAKQAAVARTIALQNASNAASVTGGQGGTGVIGSTPALTGMGTGGGAGAGMSVGMMAGIFAAAVLIVNNYSKTSKTTWGTFDVGSPSQVPNRYGYGNAASGINTSAAVGGAASLAAMQARADAFVKALRDMVNGIGATLDELAAVSVKKAGQGSSTHWRVYVPDPKDPSKKVMKDFGKDETAAMNYALISVLKASTLGNVSPLVQAGIDASKATTAEQLKSDIDFLRNLERSVMSEGQAWASARLEQLQQERDRLRELVGATNEFGNAVRKLDEAFAKDVLAQRNAALGIQETEQQAAARRIAEFNSQLAALRKPIEDELAALLAQLARGIQGPPVLVNPGEGNGPRPAPGPQTPGEPGSAARESTAALGQLGGAITALGQGALGVAAGMALAAAAAGGSADEIRARIAELQAMLQSAAFTPISPEEAARAGRGDGSAAQARADALKGFRDKLAQLREAVSGSEVAGIFGDLTRSIRDLRAEGKKAGASQAELAEGERLLREQAQKTIKARIDQLTGKGPSEFAQQLIDGLKFFADLRAKEQTALGGKVLQVGGGHFGEQQAFLERMRGDLTASILEFAGLTDPMTAVNLQAARMRADLQALATAGGISAEELARLTGAIDAGTEAARQRAEVERAQRSNDLLLQLYGYLSASHQNAELELTLKRRKVELDFAVMRASLVTAGIWEANAGLFNQALADALAAAAAGPPVEAMQQAADTQQSAADLQKQAAEQFAATTKSLMDAQRALRGGNAALSYLDPRAQIDYLQSHLDATIAAARGGSLEARGAAGQEVLDFIARVQETFTSGSRAQALARHYDEILSQLIAQTTFNVGNVAYGAFPGQNPAATTPVVYGGPAPSSGGGGDWTRVETAVSRVESVDRDIANIMRAQGGMQDQRSRELAAKVDRMIALLEEVKRDLRMNLSRAA